MLYATSVYHLYAKKNILIPNVAEKNILLLVEEKKLIWFRVFVIYPNVKFLKKNILTLVLSENNLWTKQKTITPPPLKLNGRSLSGEPSNWQITQAIRYYTSASLKALKYWWFSTFFCARHRFHMHKITTLHFL